VKTNVFIGKFIYQTYHVVESARACAPLEMYSLLQRRALRLRTTGINRTLLQIRSW